MSLWLQNTLGVKPREDLEEGVREAVNRAR